MEIKAFRPMGHSFCYVKGNGIVIIVQQMYKLDARYGKSLFFPPFKAAASKEKVLFASNVT